MKLSISQIILWLFVIMLGIELGAGIYEALVVVPMWSSAIPDSVIAYFRHNTADPALSLNAGGRFWIYATPFTGLLSVATLLTSFKTRPGHRKWRIAGSAVALVLFICTFAWFVPNIIKLGSPAVLTMDRGQLASIATWWVRLNWVRAVIYFLAWLALLRALTIPSTRADGE